MSIKADRWIRRMALEQGMIEPFVDTQVRQGIISYGLTSYGYDMRVTNQFKVFTNVFNVLVDPKNFNPRSFVDIEADHIDIPPNSFALAQSYERFRIPRNVSSVVIGKSTYARCFRGDTRVALVDGTAPTLEEMAGRANDGELFWGYSIGPTGHIIVTLLEEPRYIGTDSLLEIILDNGEAIRCTPDHIFLRRDGREAIADELRPGDSLMPLYRELYRGYEAVYQPLNGFLYPTHRLADEWTMRQSIYSDVPGTHRHHKDKNRRNNNPWNLERMEAVAHIRRSALDQTGSICDAARLLECDRAVFRRFPEIIHASKGPQMRNHKVAAIRNLPGSHDVYCLSVPEAGNFALDAGVFVHNCGIIINVTPLEPEWEGYVTIEISNTTPLPARIYANEGIGQVLFFESDEECEMSYADKRGKYQDQEGIVLPRIDKQA
jgi:deoxycytidine triphosphate deaminase